MPGSKPTQMLLSRTFQPPLMIGDPTVGVTAKATRGCPPSSVAEITTPCERALPGSITGLSGLMSCALRSPFCQRAANIARPAPAATGNVQVMIDVLVPVQLVVGFSTGQLLAGDSNSGSRYCCKLPGKIGGGGASMGRSGAA